MNIKLESELESLKRNEQIYDWSVALGYGAVEYTIDLKRNNTLDIKALAKLLAKNYGAKEFSRHVDGSSVAVKFVVEV